MRVDPPNRRELRIVVASLAASLGIHAAAFGLFPPLATESGEPPAPISVTLRTAPPTPTDVPEDPPLAAAIDVPVAAPPTRRAPTPERALKTAQPNKASVAVPGKRWVTAAPESVAAAPLPKPLAPAQPRHASTPSASTLMAVGREPARKIALAPVTAPSFRADYLDNPPPVYPRQARRDGIEGTVTLKVLVTSAGTPAKVVLETSSGSDTLDRAALNAVKAWRFVPARRGDEAIDAWVLVPVAFRLESG